MTEGLSMQKDNIKSLFNNLVTANQRTSRDKDFEKEDFIKLLDELEHREIPEDYCEPILELSKHYLSYGTDMGDKRPESGAAWHYHDVALKAIDKISKSRFDHSRQIVAILDDENYGGNVRHPRLLKTAEEILK
jgi:hypothetical protein